MKLNFRPAVESDARLIFDWRNDPLTRQQSHNTHALDWYSHLEWFRNVLLSDDRIIQIGLNESEPCGSIRQDRISGKKWLLSWMINPALRGQGFGKALLQQFVLKYPGDYLAEIKNENIASIKMVQTAGFQLIEQRDHDQVWSFSIESKVNASPR
jgi:RimJ/RimL family protein N-acetyltransferase